MKRWFFWYLRPSWASAWTATRPERLTDPEAFHVEFRTKSSHLGATMYRFVYDPSISPNWVADTRSDQQLLVSAPIPQPRRA